MIVRMTCDVYLPDGLEWEEHAETIIERAEAHVPDEVGVESIEFLPDSKRRETTYHRPPKLDDEQGEDEVPSGDGSDGDEGPLPESICDDGMIAKYEGE